jgi:hypothetical protein
MRATLLSLLAVSLGLVTSCKSSTVQGSGGRELTIVRPAHQTLRRGETNRVAIMVLRDNIPDSVTVQFGGLPRGVKVVEVDRKVNPNELTVNYTLHAANDADLVSNHRATVTAQAPGGLSATESLSLTVKG